MAPTPRSKWGQTPVIRSGYDRYKFKNMIYLGMLPGRVIKNDVKCERFESPHIFRYGAQYCDLLIPLAGDEFSYVLPTETNTKTTIASWDNKKPTSYSDGSNLQFYVLSLQFTQHQYKEIFHNSVAPSEELFSYMDLNKSGGFPSSFFGINSKMELLMDPGYRALLRDDPNFRPELPIWTGSPKKEPKKILEIAADKIRIFQIPCYELLKSQLKFGKRSSLRLKEFKWSAYGFNPYSGGAHRIATNLARKPYRLYYDVSGWDKFLPLLNDVYDIQRATCFRYFLPEDKAEFDWMVQNTINHVIKFPDGTVYAKPYGNPSGSGTTTRDNIIAHIIILTYAMAKAYFLKYGELPNIHLLASQIAYLFGDDSCIAVDEEFSMMCDENFMSDIFASFGMTLKFLHGGFDYPINQMEFLGFTFTEIEGYWYPKYNHKRLAFSMIYESRDKLSRPEHISKAFVLTMMSYPTQYFSVFRGAYENLLISLQGKPINEVEESFLAIGPITSSMARSVFQGLEAPTPSSVFFLEALVAHELIPSLLDTDVLCSEEGRYKI